MNNRELEKQAIAAKTAADELDKAITWLESERERLNGELTRLGEERAEILAAVALGEAEDEAWDAARRASTLAEQRISDIVQAVELLRQRKAPQMSMLQHCNQTLSDLHRKEEREHQRQRAKQLKAEGCSTASVAQKMGIGVNELRQLIA